MWRWRRNGSAPEQASTSVIDQGCELEGRLTFVGTLVLNGKFRGELFSSDTLLVGETGQAEAEVQVGVAIVSGQVTGNLIARERVELRGSARIFGDIVTPVLVLEEGVVFDGRCKMKTKEIRAVQKSS
ncbi:MAG: polymer-forming cytoskeletal protein [Deltaproteobacteria bacterium]|nr:polymer-forming cytoskeletal protein [Deltaproteobacteria bacterium]